MRDLGKRAAALLAARLAGLFGNRAGNRPGILVYHRISPACSGVPAPTWNVRPERFREQLVGLRDRGYRVSALADLLRCHVEGRVPPPRTVVLTFDDGYAGVFRHAWPLLEELRLPATVFLNTAYLDGDVFPFDAWALAHRDRAPGDAYRPLTTDQCRAMAAGGAIELAAHTHTHLDLRGRADEFQRDLETCVETLRSRFGITNPAFAFPFGRPHAGFVTHELVGAAKRAGVACGLTTENRVVDPLGDPFWWGRFNAFDFDTAATLAGKLDGWYGWAPAVQEWMAGRGRARARSRVRQVKV